MDYRELLQRADKLGLLTGDGMRTQDEKIIDNQQVAIRKLQQQNGDLEKDLHNLRFGITWGFGLTLFVALAVVLLYLAATADASPGAMLPRTDLGIYTSTTMSIVVLRAFWGFWR